MLKTLGRSVYLTQFEEQRASLSAFAAGGAPVFISLHISEEFDAAYCARVQEMCDFLSAQGYTDFSGEGCLATLTRRLAQCEDFPHEIGVFLDYPLEDVIGFIHNRGSGFCCLGCWKAYSNAEAAEKTFALYRKCREVYLNCYGKGFDVARLTVAA